MGWSGCFHWALSQFFSFSSRIISSFVQSHFFVTRQKFFWYYFVACSCQVNLLVEFLVIIEISVLKWYIICSDLCVWLQVPSRLQPFYFSPNRINTFPWGKWAYEGASRALNVPFLFFLCPFFKKQSGNSPFL